AQRTADLQCRLREVSRSRRLVEEREDRGQLLRGGLAPHLEPVVQQELRVGVRGGAGTQDEDGLGQVVAVLATAQRDGIGQAQRLDGGAQGAVREARVGVGHEFLQEVRCGGAVLAVLCWLCCAAVRLR